MPSAVMQGNSASFPGAFPTVLHAEKRITLKSEKIGKPGDEAIQHCSMYSDHLSSLDFHYLLATLVMSRKVQSCMNHNNYYVTRIYESPVAMPMAAWIH